MQDLGAVHDLMDGLEVVARLGMSANLYMLLEKMANLVSYSD